MRIGSLFSGIGGLELGLERAGLGHTVWQVETNPFCRSVLSKHWPEVPRYEDVASVGVSALSPVDLICGGFPCQDVSSAGARAGLAGAKSGLWYEYRRIVDELRPRFVVIENVASGRSHWLPFVRRDLHVLGYRTRAYALSAAEVGAPHLRRRIFVVADAVREGLEGQGVPGAARDRAAWSAEPDVPRMDDGVPARVDRVKALGNAVVPQCAEVIGRIIAEHLGLGEAAG